MYTRIISIPPENLVQDGKPNFGTYSGAPKKISIKGIRLPFAGRPISSPLINFRIKSRLSLMFSLGNLAGWVEFFDAKLFGTVQVFLWDLQTGERRSCRSLLGPRARLVPRDLGKAVCANLRRKKKVLARWDRSADSFHLEFDVAGRKGAFAGSLDARFSDRRISETASVIPWPRKDRCSASYQMANSAEANISVPQAQGEAALFVELNRTLLHLRTTSEYLTGCMELDGKKISFRLAQNQPDAEDPDSYNENLLYVEGRATPLPPVLITHPYGLEKQWVIQDTEGMVDLVFEPCGADTWPLTLLVARLRGSTVFGKFEGFVMDKDGTRHNLKNFAGVAKRQELRC